MITFIGLFRIHVALVQSVRQSESKADTRPYLTIYKHVKAAEGKEGTCRVGRKGSADCCQF